MLLSEKFLKRNDENTKKIKTFYQNFFSQYMYVSYMYHILMKNAVSSLNK